MDDLAPVAVAGGTGFTGRRVVALLARRGLAPVVLARRTSDVSVLPTGTQWRHGDLGDAASVAAWLAGCRSLLWCASMGFGHVPAAIEAARAAGLRRALFVSTTAIFTTLRADSKARRQAAEAAVLGSGLAWTIVRPTMIYGAAGDRNMERLLRAVAQWPALPVPGSGRALIQPVHVDDLADGIVRAFEADVAVGRAYELSGAAPLPLDDVIDAAASAVGRRVAKVHLPLAPVAWTLGVLESMGVSVRVRKEQVLRLAEDKAFPHDAAARDFGYAPRPFDAGIREEARLLGLGQGTGVSP